MYMYVLIHVKFIINFVETERTRAAKEGSGGQGV